MKLGKYIRIDDNDGDQGNPYKELTLREGVKREHVLLHSWESFTGWYIQGFTSTNAEWKDHRTVVVTATVKLGDKKPKDWNDESSTPQILSSRFDVRTAVIEFDIYTEKITRIK